LHVQKGLAVFAWRGGATWCGNSPARAGNDPARPDRDKARGGIIVIDPNWVSRTTHKSGPNSSGRLTSTTTEIMEQLRAATARLHNDDVHAADPDWVSTREFGVLN
jgi:hypothetical protein